MLFSQSNVSDFWSKQSFVVSKSFILISRSLTHGLPSYSSSFYRYISCCISIADSAFRREHFKPVHSDRSYASSWLCEWMSERLFVWVNSNSATSSIFYCKNWRKSVISKVMFSPSSLKSLQKSSRASISWCVWFLSVSSSSRACSNRVLSWITLF